MTLLRGDDDILHILTDGDQGTGLHEIIPPVSYQIFDSFPGFWEKLHLIEDNETFPVVELHTVMDGQQHIEGVQIVQVLVKIPFYILGCLGKIDQDVAFIFLTSKFLHNGGFPDPSGTFHKQCLLSVGILLPRKKFVVYFSFKDHTASPPTTSYHNISQYAILCGRQN